MAMAHMTSKLPTLSQSGYLQKEVIVCITKSVNDSSQLPSAWIREDITHHLVLSATRTWGKKGRGSWHACVVQITW